jgi:hypothetical protein
MTNSQSDLQTLNTLAPVLGRLAQQLPPEAIVLEARRAVTLPPWNPVLQELASRLPPEEAAQAAGEVAKQMTGPQEWQRAATLGKLADRLPPEEAAALCTRAAETIFDFLAKNPTSGWLGRVAPFLKELLARLPAEQASRLWTRVAEWAGDLTPEKPRPGLPSNETFAFLWTLREVAEHLPPDQASGLCTGVGRKALHLMATSPDGSFRDELGRGLAELAAWLPPDEAVQASTALLDRIASDRSASPAVMSLGEAAGKVAERLSPEEASRAARRVADLMTQGGGGIRFASALGTLAGHLPPDGAADLCASSAVLLLDAPDSVIGVGAPRDEGKRLRRLAEHCRDQELIALLLHPFAVGTKRSTLLGVVNKRLGQEFRSRWELVDWLRQHRPDLDLASPPRHPHH